MPMNCEKKTAPIPSQRQEIENLLLQLKAVRDETSAASIIINRLRYDLEITTLKVRNYRILTKLLILGGAIIAIWTHY